MTGAKAWGFEQVKRKIRYSLFRQRWNIAVTGHSAAATAGLCGAARQRAALDDLIWMAEDREGFAADPFVMPPTGGEKYHRILFEFLPWNENLGRIESVRLLPDGRFSEKALVLDSTHHLSYPFVIEHDGSYGFIPEHAQSRDLSFYVIDDDGKAFSKTTIGAGLPLIDSTIFQWQGRYWMFATHEGDAVNSDLYIYHAPGLAGPWTEHRQNPVKQDRGNARPAGQIILHEGRPFRPAQDCISHYGSGIVVNAILTLTETEFEERPVSEIRPGRARYDYGLHTIASAGDMTVIDGARLESALHPALDSLGRYIRP